MDDPATRRFQGRVWIGFGWVSNGYAWAFPKREQLTVGMGVSSHGQRIQLMKQAFGRLLDQFCPGQGNLSVTSHPISIFRRRRRLVRGPLLLVGEAGSLVQPLTAEGIYYAIKSAHLAADAVDDYLSGQTGDLMAYQERVDREIGSFFDKTRVFSGLFYGLPRLAFRLFVNDNRFLHRYFGTDIHEGSTD